MLFLHPKQAIILLKIIIYLLSFTWFLINIIMSDFTRQFVSNDCSIQFFDGPY